MELNDLINKITCADCMDILKQLPDKCVDLILTDPPYNIQRFNRKDGGNSKKIKSFGDREKNWNDLPPSKEMFDEIFRVSKNQIIFGMNNFELPPSEHFIVWDKMQKMPSFAECELAWSSCSTPAKIIRCRFETDKIHPAQKPIDLIAKILVNYSKENDLVLDCFSGSGTTAIACHRLKRRFICIEKDPEYAKASVKRLEDEQRQGTLF